MGEIDVVMGPRIELHAGVHQSLLDTPPPGVRHRLARCRHEYSFRDVPEDAFSPFEHFTLDEVARFDYETGRPQIVYTSRLPADGHVPWLVEADCLLATLIYGRDFILGREEAIRQGLVDAGASRLRQRLMLRHYLDPSCHAILFRTRYRRSLALSYLASERLLRARDLERFEAKADVLHPTMPAAPSPAVESGPVSVLYMGRIADVKGADVAWRVFGALAERFGPRVELVWVGETPTRAHRPEILILPLLDRRAYLDWLRRSHVFFSPTLSESWGAALVEAACHGLAIVTTKDDGMEHATELFEEGRHALLVSNRLAADAREAAFVRSLVHLLEHPEHRRAMSQMNLERTTHGPLSIAERDRKLGRYYETMWAHAQATHAQRRSRRMTRLHRLHGLRHASVSDDSLQEEYARRLAGGGRHIRVR
ncbi:MAG: glycosyltransferase [Candidatus Rokuibacteriota bacterium]